MLKVYDMKTRRTVYLAVANLCQTVTWRLERILREICSSTILHVRGLSKSHPAPSHQTFSNNVRLTTMSHTNNIPTHNPPDSVIVSTSSHFIHIKFYQPAATGSRTVVMKSGEGSWSTHKDHNIMTNHKPRRDGTPHMNPLLAPTSDKHARTL